MKAYHISVLLQQTIEQLHVESGKKYIDATVGGGGHSLEIVKRGGRVLGIDQDHDAIAQCTELFASYKDNITLVQGNFEHIEEIAKAHDFTHIAGILYDLGISSHHVDEGERGFSFLQDAPLDMRMNQQTSVTAADLVNGLHKGELQELFEKYGEEHFAKRIAEEIIRVREKGKITTTGELAKIVARVYPGTVHKVHPATKVFQALRIAVNDELMVLQKSLPQALNLLQEKGRIVVISFHSLEDRIIKQTFLSWEQQNLGKVITKKPLVPSELEIQENYRSRSSKLRVFEKQ